MFTECLVADGDYDWEYATILWCTHWVSADDQTCGECHETIPAGLPHTKYVGRRPDTLCADDRPGEIDTHRTCETCACIWDDLAGGESMMGMLDQMLFDAYDTPLTALPEDNDGEDYEQLINAYDIPTSEIEELAQPPGTPAIRRMLAGLDLLTPFISDRQLLTCFRWAHNLNSTNEGEQYTRMQETIREQEDRIDRMTSKFDDLLDRFVTLLECTVHWSAEDGDFVGRCTSFPSLSWLAPTSDEAMSGIRKLLRRTIEDMIDAHETLPPAVEATNPRELISAMDPEVMLFDGLDAALIGTIHRCGQPVLAAYSYTACIDEFMAQGLTSEQAIEHMSFNVEGAWVGERTPCVVHPLEEE